MYETCVNVAKLAKKAAFDPNISAIVTTSYTRQGVNMLECLSDSFAHFERKENLSVNIMVVSTDVFKKMLSFRNDMEMENDKKVILTGRMADLWGASVYVFKDMPKNTAILVHTDYAIQHRVSFKIKNKKKNKPKNVKDPIKTVKAYGIKTTTTELEGGA